MKFFRRLLCFSCALLFPFADILAQDPPAAEAEQAEAVAATTSDPAIPVKTLEKLLKAPTMEELAIEAEGWRDLLKGKVEELARAEIASLETKAALDEAADGESAPAAEEAAEDKDQINEQLAALNDEKAAILERLNIVLDAWEKKGGEADNMRTYAKAVSGIQMEVSDAGASAAAIKGWLVSKDGGMKWGMRILQFVGIMAVFWAIAGIVGRIVRKATSMHKNMSALLRNFINKLVRRIVLLIGLLVALSMAGVNVGAMVALIGGGAFIIGFALQDTLGNFAAGIMLLIYRPFDEGHFVSIGGVSGKVSHVSLVSTTILTPDNQVILVPNKKVWGEVITNVTGSSERRVDMVFGIGYDDDMAKAQKILEKVVASHEKVLADPAPVIKVNELADSSVNFVCRPWAKTADYWDVYWDITRQVKEQFDANKITIPFPQQDLHIHQTK